MKSLLTTMMFYLFMTSTNATIIHNDITDITLASGGSIEVDFDGIGGAEFTINDGGFTAVEPSIFFNQGAHFVTISTAEWDVIKGLPLNTAIGANTGWHDQGDAYIDPFWGTTMFPTGDIYLGAQFNLGTNVHYGWILVNWDAAGTFIVKSYAYEDAPNTSINAGDQGSTAILVNNITVQGQGAVNTITTNGGTLQMTATVLPANATNSNVTWSVVNGTGAATINANGILSAVSNGTVTVTATANDASGISNAVVITISGQQLTSISMINADEVVVYPNPTSSVINIALSGNFEEYTLILYSIEGKEVINIAASKVTEQLDIQHLNKGVYYLRVMNKNTSFTKTIIKK